MWALDHLCACAGAMRAPRAVGAEMGVRAGSALQDQLQDRSVLRARAGSPPAARDGTEFSPQ